MVVSIAFRCILLALAVIIVIVHFLTECKTPKPSDEDIYNETYIQAMPYAMDNTTHSFISNYSLFTNKIERFCNDMRTVGDGDGYWEDNALRRVGQLPYRLCYDPKIAPVKENCIVFSFGISKDWSFDDAMAQQAGCKVYSYDPTISLEEHIRPTGVHFYPIGIAARSGTQLFEVGNQPVETLSRLFELTGLNNRTIDVVKIDVEGEERNIIQDPVSLELLKLRVKQLIIEWHDERDKNTPPAYENIRRIAGFQSYYAEPRRYRRYTFSVESMMNSRFA